MASIDPHSLPYKPRRQRSVRPDRPLPAPPPEEDVEAVNSFEQAQAFTSPPSPPRPSKLAPPPLPQPPQPPTGGAQISAAHLHPFINALPGSDDAHPPTILTPLRAHYLKKTLVNLQLSHELQLLTDPALGANALGLLGDPFVLPEEAKKEALARVSEVARVEGRVGDLPFMRFLFHQFLLPFPFLASAPPTFWSAKVQPFLSSFLSNTGYSQKTSLSPEEEKVAESLMTKEERKEAEDKKKLWAKVEKHLALMVGVGVKLTTGEEVVRIGQSDLRRLEEAQAERARRWAERHAQPQASSGPPDPNLAVVFNVNVIGIRAVTEKGRVRNRTHEEFLVRTQRNGVGDTFVSRRYGDFKRLGDELRTAFPDYPFPSPPPKDKTVTTAPVAPAQYSYYNPLRAIYGSSPNPSSTSSPSNSPNPADAPSMPGGTTHLSREKNRLTLRAYLLNILAIPFVINSPILRSFLLSNPIILTPTEALDSQRRLEADAVREEGRRRFREEAEKRIEVLREGLQQFKGDVLSRDGGLRSVFDVVRRVDKVENLPKAEASVLEWGRISLAATIFQLFVASDTASDTLASLKRLHGLMPYFVLKGILRATNPMAMIRGVLDLFLARPFGGQSLIQRMFSSSLAEDVRLVSEDIEAIAEKIDDPVLSQKIEHYANAPFEIQEVYRKDAVTEGLDLLVVILRSPDMPSLSRPQFQRVFRASRSYKEYKAAQAELEDSDDDLGPENDDAWLFEDLNVLLKLWTRKREKEQLLALIFEGVTAELLKDIITIFYTPLAQVYKAASIADSLGDLQNFLNDMIRTVEQVEELSQEDPQRTVQTFIDLVQRHEQSFYTFVHNVHAKGHGLFDSLMSWIELFLSYARDGLPQPIDLEFILPHAGPERAAIMAEVDAVAQYHYRLKVAHEEKVRRRFNKAAGAPDGQAVEEAALLDSVMASLNVGENVVGEAGELEPESEEDAQDEEEDEESEGSSIRSSQQSTSVSAPGPPMPPRPAVRSPPTPELTTDSALPFLSPDGGGKRDRTGSGTSGRSSLDKIRSSVEFRRKSPNPDEKSKDKEKEREKEKDEKRNAAPRIPKIPVQGHGGKKGRKARKAAALEMMISPETKAVAELRPLFVEILRPLLRVRSIQLKPPGSGR